MGFFVRWIHFHTFGSVDRSLMEVRKCEFRSQRFREQASRFWASAVTVQPIWFYSNSDSERPPALILRKVLMGKMIKMGTSGGSRYTAGTQGLLRFCSRKPIVFFPAIHVTNFFEFVLLG
jgi:hypothetical protein